MPELTDKMVQRAGYHPDMNPLNAQIQDLKRQIAELESKKRAIVEREVRALGIIGKRVMYGKNEYEVSGYRITGLGGIRLRGKRVLKAGNVSMVEVDLYGWEMK